MLWKIARFELKYRSKRPATYIYFGILFLLCFLAVAIDNVSIGGASGQLKDDASFIVGFQIVIMSIVSILVSSAVMGVPVIRDFEHRTSALMFTAPIKKRDYLFGRFLGSYIVLLLILLSIPLGLMLGRIMSHSFGWVEADRFLSEFHPEFYWNAFLIFVVPNAFVSGALFFMGGSLSKRLLFVFVQGMGLLTLYLISGQLIRELEDRSLAAFLDPFGTNTYRVATQYWTITEQNYEMISFSGEVLQNRLLWLLIGVVALVITYFSFSFSTSRKKSRKKKSSAEKDLSKGDIVLPNISGLTTKGFAIQFQRIIALSRLYYREIVRSTPFLAIAGCGIAYLMIGATNFEAMYGTDSYPKTFLMLGLLGAFDLFLFIIVIFYSGELIWRERDLRINQIYDAMPFPNFLGLLSKFIGFVMVHITLLLLMILVGVLIQTAMGYTEYELGVYFNGLFTETLGWLVLYTLLAFFVQTIANNKFLGHALMVVFFVILGFLGDIGLEHRLFQFASGSLGSYSDMNAYGHYVAPFSWFQFYWFAFTLVLFALTVVFAVRGTDTILKTRLKLAGQRFARPILIFTMASLVMFASTGAYIYYNTNVQNEYSTSDDQEDRQEQYELTLKKYQDIPQPRIVETNLKVDIYPEERDFTAEGFYILKNKTDQSIDSLHIQFPSERDMNFDSLTFAALDSSWEGEVSLARDYDQFRYQIFAFEPALAPGDSFRLNFKGNFKTVGFKEGGSNNEVVYNGTFFNTSYFPGIGYEAGFELGDDDERKKRGLPERERMRDRDDPIGQKMNLIGDDADNIRFEVVMSTTPDQTAIAPGYLQREWDEDGRHYFHYKMDKPMFNFYSLVSARYETVQEKWVAPYGDTIDLAIYYNKGHDYNLDRMMESMKHSLTYYSNHFSPYQFRQMRIMEFPRYRSFAQSFANTVPFSEGIGFILNIGKDDVDIAYYVTAHELAHQWWGHQVSEADVQGNAMLSESMSQYSALMVMKEKYPPEMMQKFLKYELDRYLGGRRAERKKERPLALVESQQYIHYRKGSLVMYAMQDYISEDSMNIAMKRYLEEWTGREDQYPTTKDFLRELRKVTPDSLEYLITDMFETITLYENRVLGATFAEKGDGQYLVSIDISTIKYRADSLGNETPIAMKDWIDVGVYGESKSGKDTLLYLSKHLFRQDSSGVSIIVDQKPTKAGIDPIYKLIDRNPEDNIEILEELVQ